MARKAKQSDESSNTLKLTEDEIRYLDSVITDEQAVELAEMRAYFSRYPDKFLDFYQDKSISNFSLLYFQRGLLREMFRYQTLYVVGARGVGKTFLHVLSHIIWCILFPNSARYLIAPAKIQTDKIIQKTVTDLLKRYPFLENEIVKTNAGKVFHQEGDYYDIRFPNGSVIYVGYSGAKARGERNTAIGKEEAAHPDNNFANIASEIEPTKSNGRQTMNNKVNIHEIQSQSMSITNAQSSNGVGYRQLMEVKESMKTKTSAYFTVLDCEISMRYGLLLMDEYFQHKYSTTEDYNAFLQNFHCYWVGGLATQIISESALKYMHNLKYPVLQNKGDGWRYILSFDVANTMVAKNNANHALIVMRFRYDVSSDKYDIQVVGAKHYSGMLFQELARQLKDEVLQFNPEVLIIDANAVGQGILEPLMANEHDGRGCLGFIFEDLFAEHAKRNSDMESMMPHLQKQHPDSNKIIYPLKSQRAVTKNEDMNFAIKGALEARKIQFVDYTKGANRINSDILEHFHISKTDDDYNEQYQALNIAYKELSLLYKEILNIGYNSENHRIHKLTSEFEKDRFEAFKYAYFIIAHLINQEIMGINDSNVAQLKNIKFNRTKRNNPFLQRGGIYNARY